MQQRGSLTPLLLTAAVLTSGCSGTPAEAPAEQQPTGMGPLAEILFAGEADLTSRESYIDSVALVEEEIARCMAEQGFDYTPMVPAESQVTIPDGPIRGTREFAEAYGYGVWTPARDEGGGVEVRMDDPNYATVEAMRGTERQAYEDALRGPTIETFEDGSSTQAGGGCYDQAQDSAAPATFDEQAAQEAMDFLSAAASDSIFDPLNREWSQCMRAQGYTAANPTQAEEDIRQDWSALTSEGETSPGADVREREADNELATAAADMDCREEVDYTTRYTELDHQRQADYLTTHEADLTPAETST